MGGRGGEGANKVVETEEPYWLASWDMLSLGDVVTTNSQTVRVWPDVECLFRPVNFIPAVNIRGTGSRWQLPRA